MSDSVQPHRRQPTRLPCPWDSPGKNTGVGCHSLLQCMKVKSESEVTQSSLTLSYPMDCSPSGSSAHGIFQARVLEWTILVMLKSPTINIFHPPLHPHIFSFTAKILVFAHYLLFLKSHSFSNPLQSGFCLYCFSEIAFVNVTDLLVSSSGGDFSVLQLFQLPGTFGLIFTLGFGDANSPGFLPTSSSLLLRCLCQFPFFCLFLKVTIPQCLIWYLLFSLCIPFPGPV